MDPKKVQYGAPCREVTPEEMKKFTASAKKAQVMEKVEGFLHKRENGKEKRTR